MSFLRTRNMPWIRVRPCPLRTCKSSEKRTGLSLNSEPVEPGFSLVLSPISKPADQSPFSEPRICRTSVRPGPFYRNSEPARVWRNERAFLRTFQTRVIPSPFSELRTRVTWLTPNLISELRAKNTILDHFVFVTFPCGVYTLRLYIKFVLCLMSYVLDQVWCLIVSIPDLCLLSYFHSLKIVLSFVFFFSKHQIMIIYDRLSNGR